MTTDVGAAQPDRLAGLYLLKLQVGNVGELGAPVLYLGLTVYAPTGKITGQGTLDLPPVAPVIPPEAPGQQQPPVIPTEYEVTIDSGQVVETSIRPPRTILTLSGFYLYRSVPIDVLVSKVPLSAVLIPPSASEEGRGNFTYGGRTIKDVPVRIVNT